MNKNFASCGSSGAVGGGGGLGGTGRGGVKDGHGPAELSPPRPVAGAMPVRSRRSRRGTWRRTLGAAPLYPREGARAREGAAAPGLCGSTGRPGHLFCLFVFFFFLFFCFSFFSFFLFSFSSSVGLLGAAGLGEQRGHARSKGSPEARRCRGSTGVWPPRRPHPSNTLPGGESPSQLPERPQTIPGLGRAVWQRTVGHSTGKGGGGGRDERREEQAERPETRDPGLGAPLGIRGTRPPPTRGAAAARLGI